MSNNALHRVASAASLGAAFDYMYANSSRKSRSTFGVDGVTMAQVSQTRGEFMSSLSMKVRSKQFEFSKLSPHFIKKSSGKERVICIPTVRDRIVQRALNDALANKYGKTLDNSVSFGFLKDKGVKKAAERACELRQEFPWVFKTDISAFFDEIPRTTLKKHVRAIIREPSLYPLIDAVIDCEIAAETATAATRIRRQGIVAGKGIRQGMPLSPMLSNVMLHRFDASVIKAGLHAVRYADDVIFFTQTETQCLEIFDFCRKNLNLEGLKIPPLEEKSKSVIYAPDEAADFLGLAMNRKANKSYALEVSPEQMAAIRTELFKLTDLAELKKKGINFFKFGQALDSRVGGYSAAYTVCANHSEFDAKLSQMRDKIYKTVLENLGIKPATLSANARQFFCL